MTTAIYCGFAVGAYMLYGDVLNAVISCNIGGVLGECVRAALVLQLTFATPLNAHPVWSTIEPSYVPRLGKYKWWLANVIRGIIIVLCAVVAFSIPYFGSFSNFIGAVAVSLSTWILPPLFYMKAQGGDQKWPSFLLNWACIGWGIAVSVSCAAITIMTLINQIESGVKSGC